MVTEAVSGRFQSKMMMDKRRGGREGKRIREKGKRSSRRTGDNAQQGDQVASTEVNE